MSDNDITIEDALSKYKDDEKFYYAYLDCMPLVNFEGEVLEDVDYCGYALKDEYGRRYFTEYGIRGMEHGTYYIHNGEPVKVRKELPFEDKSLIMDICFGDDKEGRYELYNKVLSRDAWYKYQIEQIKNKKSC